MQQGEELLCILHHSLHNTCGKFHMGLYAGIDLHSRNSYVGVSDDEDKRIFRKKLGNQGVAFCCVKLGRERVSMPGYFSGTYPSR